MGEEQEENNEGRAAGRKCWQGVGGRGQSTMPTGHSAEGLINKIMLWGWYIGTVLLQQEIFYCWMPIRGWGGQREKAITNHKGQCKCYTGRGMGCKRKCNGGGRIKNSKLHLLVLNVHT